MGNTSPIRCDGLPDEDRMLSSPSLRSLIVATNVNGLSGEEFSFATTESGPLSTQQRLLTTMLGNGLTENDRSASREPHRAEKENSSTESSHHLEKQTDYLERRRKNNDAARRSREVRRQREALNRRQVETDYLERRRKNNDAARRSREVRRQREALNRRQVELLEQENVQLRAQIALLRLEVGQLSFVLLAEGAKLRI
ncbi:basic region leucine zipper [Dictyocaulus viviparus]|uniref:Basic region leucine zipper n=1 Tax=Dictyocaulus viviparus TaxID=29172 RepID=A0A0D8Y195_DICVI|nr:basic region leucine zipper [Dictyocaulus viviparus]